MFTKKFFVAQKVDGVFKFVYDAKNNPVTEEHPTEPQIFLTEVEALGKERRNSVLKYSELHEDWIVTRETGFEYNDMFYIPVPGVVRGPEPMGAMGAFAAT